jgi:hypothetical protein
VAEVQEDQLLELQMDLTEEQIQEVELEEVITLTVVLEVQEL